jgi:hypothetical protein
MTIVANSNDSNLKGQLKRAPDGGGDTAQGFYVVGADGKFYGWNNAHYMPEVLRFMGSALEAFRQNPPGHVEISQAQISAPFSHSPDLTTSVVRVYTRIRPLPTGCGDLNRSVGRDHLWIYADDIEEILAASTKEKSFSLPKKLVARLVRFHMIDNVRGEPDDWQSEDVKQATFTAQLLRQDATSKHFQFHGVYAQETANHRRGQEGTLDGEFDIVLSTGKVASFRAFGEALAWGESRWTPGAPKGKFGLVTAMISVQDETSNAVPPQFMWGDGQYYHAPELVLLR